MDETISQIVTDDGHCLFARQWQQTGPVVGDVIIVHGLGEHSGRYAEVAGYLTGAGYCVASFDQRGHGRTTGKRGHVSRYDRLLRDIDCALAKFVTDRPCFLYGQSLGGNLVLNYVLRHRPKLAGIVVTSPLLQLTVAPSTWKQLLARALNLVYPAYSFDSGLQAEDMSHDADAVRAYRSNPLVHRRVSARLAVEMLRAGRYALQHAGEITMPLLLLHGAQDRVTSPQATCALAERIGTLCELYIAENGFHELHWETDRAETLRRIVTWLNDRRSTTSSERRNDNNQHAKSTNHHTGRGQDGCE